MRVSPTCLVTPSTGWSSAGIFLQAEYVAGKALVLFKECSSMYTSLCRGEWLLDFLPESSTFHPAGDDADIQNTASARA